MTEPLEKLPEERLGDFLVRAREARGLSREELSEDTHVSKSYLEWMETGDWKKFPVDAYLRSYLNSVSVRLALDPKKVLEWYAKERGMVSKENFVAPPMSNEQFAVSQEKGKSKARPIIVGVILVAILLALLYVMNLPKNDSTLPVEKEPSQEPIISEDTAETPAPILEGAESISLDSVLKEDSIAALKARCPLLRPYSFLLVQKHQKILFNKKLKKKKLVQIQRKQRLNLWLLVMKKHGLE